jgi:hypothetical protein
MTNRKLTAEELEEFPLASYDTDIFVEKRFHKDIQKISSLGEKTLVFLKDYRFVNGWIITSLGIGIFGIFASKSGTPWF